MVSKARFFICLVLLSGFATASAQTPSRKLPLTEPLEKYDNPPAYIFRIETSPGMVSHYGPFTSHQVNVDSNGNNILGDAANEPSISVDPTNGNKMAIAWRQFNSVTSNFRQAGWGYTTDGGTTWTFPGVLENNVFRSDPVSNSDETGKFFYLSLKSDQAQSFFCDDVWRSLNGGQSWTLQGPAHGGDKEWFTIDKTNGMGHGFQYQFWTGFFSCDGGEFTRSTDGGVTWMNPINIPNSPQWGTLDVDTNGNLFIGGGNGGSQFWCIRSSNAQNGGVTPTFDQITTVNLGGSIVGGGINGVGLDGQIFLAIDRSGTSTNNNIYMLASVEPTGATNGTDVMFARSTNGGQSFSAPLRINDDPINHNKWHWFGTFSVAPNGRIDSVWLDTRNAANNTDSQLFYSYSVDGGNTWSANIAVSNSFNPFIGYPNQSKIGDYMTIVSDNTGGSVAYAATFNNEEDVYYVRIPATAPIPQSAVSRKTHGAAGTFDVPLPLSGNAGIECRRGSEANFEGHQMIITFANSVTVGGVTVTSSDGLATGTQSVSGGVVTVNLSMVTDAQTITVTLTNVNDGTHLGDVPIPMGVFLGDTNGNGVVNATDIAQTKAQVGQSVTSGNFRVDVNADGTVSSSDVAIVKSHSGN